MDDETTSADQPKDEAGEKETPWDREIDRLFSGEPPAMPSLADVWADQANDRSWWNELSKETRDAIDYEADHYTDILDWFEKHGNRLRMKFPRKLDSNDVRYFLALALRKIEPEFVALCSDAPRLADDPEEAEKRISSIRWKVGVNLREAFGLTKPKGRPVENFERDAMWSRLSRLGISHDQIAGLYSDAYEEKTKAGLETTYVGTAIRTFHEKRNSFVWVLRELIYNEMREHSLDTIASFVHRLPKLRARVGKVVTRRLCP